jgi:hypothetical protein
MRIYDGRKKLPPLQVSWSQHFHLTCQQSSKRLSLNLIQCLLYQLSLDAAKQKERYNYLCDPKPTIFWSFEDCQTKTCQVIISAFICRSFTSTIVASKQSCIKHGMRRHRVYTKEVNFKNHKQHVNKFHNIQSRFEIWYGKEIQ